MASSWLDRFLMRWERRWDAMVTTLSSPHFWWTLLGVLAALAVWVVLFRMAIQHLDTSLSMHSTFCTTHEERNWHILALVLLTPLFLVGLIGVIGEWMAQMETRRKGRKAKWRALIVFSILMQVTALFILIALNC